MSKWLIGFLFITFVGWMVFDVGMDVTGQTGGSNTELARVNGTSIGQQAFYDALRNAQEAQRNRAGSAPTTLEEQKQLENQVLEEMIQRVLLADELRERGIRVSNEEIISAAKSSPPPEVMDAPDFQTDGKFDMAKYQRFVAATPDYQLALEARYREEIPRLKLYEELAAGVYVPTSRLWRMYRDQHDSATVRLLSISPESFISDNAVRPTEEQLVAYYSKNKKEFERPAYAYMSYVALPRLALASDTAAARVRVDSLRRLVTAGGDFAEIARIESADSMSAANGGDLGEVRLGQMVPEFDRAVLALRPGQVSAPVKTTYGWHLIKLESRNVGAKTYRARHILVPIELAGAHRDQVEARADSLDRYAAEQDDPTALDSIARQLGLAVLPSPPVAEGGRVQLGRALIPDAGVWAFGTAAPGETSPVVETDHAYYVFRLDSSAADGVPPYAAIKDDVRRAVVRDLKWEAVRTLVEQLTREGQSGARLQQVAERVKLPVQTLGPFTRVNPPVQLISALPVIGTAFGLEAGRLAGPIETRDAVYFVETASKKLADSTAFTKQLETQRMQVVQAARQDRVRQVVAALREQAKVTDRRKELDELAKKLEEAQPAGTRLPAGS